MSSDGVDRMSLVENWSSVFHWSLFFHLVFILVVLSRDFCVLSFVISFSTIQFSFNHSTFLKLVFGSSFCWFDTFANLISCLNTFFVGFLEWCSGVHLDVKIFHCFKVAFPCKHLEVLTVLQLSFFFRFQF